MESTLTKNLAQASSSPGQPGIELVGSPGMLWRHLQTDSRTIDAARDSLSLRPPPLRPRVRPASELNPMHYVALTAVSHARYDSA